MKPFLLATIVLVAISASAQTASISGIVVDQSGAVVSEANISVVNVDTGAVRTTSSVNSGTYSVPDLPAGKYRLEIRKQSFAQFRVPDITLTVDQVLTINATLKPGGANETVDVSAADLPPVDLETSQISNLVDQRQMEALPLITRNPYELVLLSPGTFIANNRLGGISVNGGRTENTNFMLDGVDNNDTSVPGIIGGVLAANPDSTEEFRVITDNFNAEYGRNTGAIVDVITKSGTNSFHGNAYYFGRWNGFGGARDYFNPVSGPNARPMNPYIRHQFGFSLGGPIIKNKTFFFFNDEMDRFITALTNPAFVPTNEFLTGKFNYTYTESCNCATNGLTHTVPIDLTPTGANNATGAPADPTMAKLFSLYPTVPASQSPDGIEGVVFFPSTSRLHSYAPVLKIDHKVNDHHSLSLRYGYGHSFDPNPGTDDILPATSSHPEFGHHSELAINYGLAAQLTSTLSNTLINNFQFGLNHIYASFFLPQNTINILNGPSVLDSLGNGWDFELDPFTNFASTLGGATSQARTTGTISYSDNITWVRGSHTLKFGFDFRNVKERGADNFFSRRQLILDPLVHAGINIDPGFVANEPVNDPGSALVDGAEAYWGLAAQDFQNQFFNKSGTREATDTKTYVQHEFDWFGQDAWKIRKNLTLSLGLRYQLNTVPSEINGEASNLFQDPGSFAGNANGVGGQNAVFTVTGAGTGHDFYQPDYKDIEPRLGLTWDPWGDGKTAIRAGFGIFHDRIFGNAFGNARTDPPFQFIYSQYPFAEIGSAAVPTRIPPQTPSTTIADGSAVANLVIFYQKFRNPASNNWNLDIQRQLPGNNVLDLAYIGAMGTHVYGHRDGNPPDPALVQQLVAYCSNPSNAFGCTTDGAGGTFAPTGLFLYQGADFHFLGGIFQVLPFNAVNNNAMIQPNYEMTEFNSIYHALQSKFTHRMSHGFQLQFSYTFAHALDNGVDPLNGNLGSRTFPRNSRNLAQSYGNSDNDVKHIGVINYIWDLPLGRGKANLNSGLTGRVLEGMELSGIFSAQTGIPFNVRGTRDSQRTGIGAWGYQVGDPFAAPAAGCSNGVGLGYIYMPNQCAFVNPPFDSPSNNARNTWRGPGFWAWDMNFSKTTSVTERVKLEFRFEGYNIFNHTHFNNVGNDSLSNLISSPEFGVITSAFTQPDGTTSARQVQAALKVKF